MATRHISKFVFFSFLIQIIAARADAQGLLFPNGIEPGNAWDCEAPAGSTCYWVDSDAPGGGNGSYNSPFNSFEEVAGWQTGSTFHPGLISGGDFLYVRGYFDANDHDEQYHNMRIHLARGFQGGTPQYPTTIKSWRGHPRAVFDGRHWLNDFVHVRALDNDHNYGVRVQNIEITRSGGRGIDIGTNVRYADVAGVVVHDGLGNGVLGEGGGVYFRAQSTQHDFTVRNSLFYNNKVDPSGSYNNIGAIGILSSLGAAAGSRVVVRHNVIHDEIIGVRHKHSGSVQMYAHNNEIYNVDRGFYFRSHDSHVYDNLLYNAAEAFYLESENQTGHIKANIFHNRIFNSGRLLNPGWEATSYPTTVSLQDNIFLDVGGADFKGADSDGDGLSNSVETGFGTNKSSTDTDGDGVSDGKELTDATDPFSIGSGKPLLPTRLCAEWNGYLYPMWNVLELVNVGSSDLSATVALHAQDGSVKDIVPLTIAAGTQFDLLVHDLPGRKLDSYGLICVEHTGGAGALDGRMAFYRGAPLGGGGAEGYEFAFGIDLTPGRRGSQFVGYNTYNPTLYEEDADNYIVNWLQLTNVSASYGTGKILFYDVNGQLVASQNAGLGPGQRFDFSGHFFGANRVGLVEWRPDNANQQFQFRNARYLYDNPFAINTFDAAFQVEASNGSSEDVVLPVSTEKRSAILELANPEPWPQAYEILVTDAGGGYLYGEEVTIGAKAVHHALLDGYLGKNNNGRVRVRPLTSGRVHTVLMNYSRDGNGRIWGMHGIEAAEAVGAVMKGSYNTYLGQESELWVVNGEEDEQRLRMGIIRSEGSPVMINEEFTVPGSGVLRLKLQDYESANNYGVITIIPEHPNTIASWVTRKKIGSYIFPTAVR